MQTISWNPTSSGTQKDQIPFRWDHFCETSRLLFLPESGKPCGEGRCPRLWLLTELLPTKGPPVKTAHVSQLQRAGALWKYPKL